MMDGDRVVCKHLPRVDYPILQMGTGVEHARV